MRRADLSAGQEYNWRHHRVLQRTGREIAIAIIQMTRSWNRPSIDKFIGKQPRQSGPADEKPECRRNDPVGCIFRKAFTGSTADAAFIQSVGVSP